MEDYKLTQINIYPIKSLPGISLKESFVEERGLQHDRRWMLVNPQNVFLTQREFPQMIFIDQKLENDKLILSHRNINIEPLIISLSEYPSKKINVEIWQDYCEADEYNNEVNDWFSEAIDNQCKLVYMPNTTHRKTSTKYFSQSKSVSFADGYPFLIIGEESLNYLNSRLIQPVSMDQFRPNFVFSGGSEHDEDKWKNIRINELNFSVIKPCARCVITTIDKQNGKKNKEPLKTLSTYRKFDHKIMFGQNVIGHSEGIIKTDAKIELI